MTNAEIIELLETENALLTGHLVSARQRVAELEAVVAGDIKDEHMDTPIPYTVTGKEVEYAE